MAANTRNASSRGNNLLILASFLAYASTTSYVVRGFVGLLPNPNAIQGSRRGRCHLGSSSSTHDPCNLKPADFLRQVHVYDGVFDPDVCVELHYLAAEHADRSGEGSSVFSWNPAAISGDDNDDDDGNGQSSDLTPLEQALGSCAQAMYTTTTTLDDESNSNVKTLPTVDVKNDNQWVVEYWSRQEFMNMEAHSDIDERLLLDEDSLVCPHYGHVLYLDMDPSVRGPTCVFSQLGGWHLSSEGEEASSSASANKAAATSLVTVPAVPGRVLRFPGSAMHAVPKPATLWLQSKAEQAETLLKDDSDELDGDDDDDDDVTMARSVILFNVWLNNGPRGVTEDCYSKGGGMPDGIQLVDDDDDKEAGDGEDTSSEERAKVERIAQWEDDFGVECADLWCEPPEDWEIASIVANNDDGDAKPSPDEKLDRNNNNALLSVPLMGNRARRLFLKKHVRLSSVSATTDLSNGLQDEHQPQHFLLVEDKE